MTNKTMSPLLLQSMMGDISQRRALAMALRARESGSGQMVSGRYVPNFGALGGAISRGLFGDPLEQLRQEEQGALTGYSDELAGATQGMLEIDPTTAEAGDFAQRTARAQVAGVPQDIVSNALKRRDSWNTLNRMLATLGEQPGGAVAGDGAQQPAAVGGAAPGGAVGAPSPGIPGQPPQGGMGKALQQGGGMTPLSGVPDGKLVMMMAVLPEGEPVAKIAMAEMKSREMKMEQGGLITRGGRPVGIFKDGVFINTDGKAEDVTGAIEMARAASKAAAEADARASRTPVSIPHGDTTRMGFATELPGYGGGQPQQAPQRAPQGGGSGKIKVNFEGTPEEIRNYVEIALRESGNAPAAPSSGGGYQVGVSMGEGDRKRQEATIDTGAKAQQGVNEDFIKSSYRPALEAGSSSTATIAQLDALDRLQLKTGWGSGVQTSAFKILTGVGVAPADARQYAAKAETFYSIVGQQNWQLLAEQKGPQTEGDANRAAKVFAQITNTEQANKFIVDLARANAMIRIEKAKFYRAALPAAQKAGDLSRVEDAWAERQPSVFSFPFMQQWGQFSEKKPAAPATPTAGARDPKVDEYLREFGGR